MSPMGAIGAKVSYLVVGLDVGGAIPNILATPTGVELYCGLFILDDKANGGAFLLELPFKQLKGN